jgi:hypothetical protein
VCGFVLNRCAKSLSGKGKNAIGGTATIVMIGRDAKMAVGNEVKPERS